MPLHRFTAATLIFDMPVVAHAATQDFTILNRTGYQIDSIYVGEAGTRILGNDVMGRDKLEDGERVAVTFDRNTEVCRYDLTVEYHDATRATWSDLDLCEISRVSLFWDKQSQLTVIGTK